jgi:4-amino-4-deoxy-L-arabinose transferase-like glycosyltransferase
MRTLPLAGLLVGLMMVPLGITRLLSDASTPGGANYGSDSNVYWDLAQNIHARHQWVYSPGLNYPGIGVRSENHHYIDNLYVLPGYPLLLSTVSRWGIETGPYALAFALYVLLSVTLWILAGRLFANAASVRTLGIWFIVYQILNPTWIVQLRAIGQDLAAAVFATLFVLWAVRSWQEHHVSLQDTFLMGISTAAAIMIKTNVLAFILPVLALLALAFWFQHRRGKASLALIGILLGLGMTALWGVHLRDLTGRFSLGANMGYGVFANYVYNSTPKEQADEQIHTLTQRFEDALQKGVPINQASMDAALNFQKISFQFIKTDPAKALKVAGRNIAAIFMGRDYFWLPQLLILRLSHQPLASHRGLSYRAQTQSLSTGMKLFSFALNGLYYGIYVLIPALCLLAFPFIKPSRGMEAGRPVLLVFTYSAILFLIVTAFILGSVRYRMPVQPIFYLCTLAVGLRLSERYRSEG